MKILMTTDNIGGVWTFALDLAKGLKDYGIEVILAITGNPMDEEREKELEGISWYFAEFKQEWMDDPWEDIQKTGNWLMDLQEMIQPDLVHLNSYSTGSLPWKVPVLITLHSCVLSWWQAVKKEPAPSSWDRYREKVKAGLNSASLITAPTRDMLSMAEKYYGPLGYTKLIYNGRRNEGFGRSQKEKFVFSMGRLWDEGKNIRQVIKAAEYSSYPFLIAGNSVGFDPGDLPANIHLKGFLPPEEIRQYLAKAAVYLLPVKYEPFGYTFLEAAFSHCALVGGNIASQHEIWGNAMNYADPDNPSEIAAVVNHLMENDELREEKAAKGYRRAVNFTADKMIAHYALQYEELKIKNHTMLF